MLAAKTFVHFNSLRKAHYSLLNSLFNYQASGACEKKMIQRTVFFSFFLSCILLMACSSEVSQEQRAMTTAQKYYEQLVAGDYNSFVEGSLMGQDSVPESYKLQMLLNARMFVERMQKEHNGIKSVKAMRAKVDTIMSRLSGDPEAIQEIVAQAYLSVAFADSSIEEIVVPMVFKDDIWYLR